MKKRDKKRFKRKDLKISNFDLRNNSDFIDEEVIIDKRAEKKLAQKYKHSSKESLQLKRGRIIEIYSNYQCLVRIDDINHKCLISGRLKQLDLDTRNIIAVGDWVKVDTNEQYRIEEVEKRKNALLRYSEQSYQKQITVAANIDLVVIITSCKQPEIKFGLVDRFICAAALSGLKPVICINKTDLVENIHLIKEEANFYENYGYQTIFCSAYKKNGIEKLKEIVKENDSVFVGHSGVGKSSLINVLQPGLNLKEGEISEYTGKGLHTTSRSRIIAWNFGGNLIDTPGIKTLTLSKDAKNEIKYIFPGISHLARKCHFQNCTHTHENDCAVKKAVEEGDFDERRYDSYLRILESLEGDYL